MSVMLHTWVCILSLASPPGTPMGLPPIPDALGFAGMFAGVHHDQLIVAGGANFPDKKPWEGGQKVWSKRVWVLDRPTSTWKDAGDLPRPLGYGVSVSTGLGVVCVGGSEASRHTADVFRLEWSAGRLTRTDLPSLPKPRANLCGALVGDCLYVAGGTEAPDSMTTTRSVFRLDLSAQHPKWEEIDPIPGSGRMLAVAASFGGEFWLLSGVDLVPGTDGPTVRKYLRDAYRYHPRTGWKRVADLPHAVAAAPNPCPVDAMGFVVVGGDDGSQVGLAPDRHRGFSKTILRYDPKANRWRSVGELDQPRVTVPCVLWQGQWVLPSGEVRPGIRSPAVVVVPMSNPKCVPDEPPS